MIKNRNYYINKSLFITATNTNVGKTYACKKFAKALTNLGLKVGYFKPFETGVKDKPLDGLSMLMLLKQLNPEFNVKLKDIVPYQFKLPAAPYVAKKDINIDFDFLLHQKKELQKKCDILIIEGAGGLMVPINKNIFIIDLIQMFQAKAILITPSKLGSINETLLSIEALKNRNIDFDFYINLYEEKENFMEITFPFLKEYFQKLYFLEKI